MAEIDYQKILATLKDSILSSVKDRSKKFLEDNKDARDFLEDRAKRLAELGVELVRAGSDEEKRQAAFTQLAVVQQSIQNQLSAVAIHASLESREMFGKILGTAVDVIVKALPVILAVI